MTVACSHQSTDNPYRMPSSMRWEMQDVLFKKFSSGGDTGKTAIRCDFGRDFLQLKVEVVQEEKVSKSSEDEGNAEENIVIEESKVVK